MRGCGGGESTCWVQLYGAGQVEFLVGGGGDLGRLDRKRRGGEKLSPTSRGARLVNPWVWSSYDYGGENPEQMPARKKNGHEHMAIGDSESVTARW